MRSKDRKILIGKIGKPHGIKGFVYFHYYGKEVSNLQLYDKLHLEDISTFKLDKIQQKSDRLIIKLVGCDDRNLVENLRNKDVYVDAVSYTHLRSPRDLSTSRMPSSA